MRHLTVMLSLCKNTPHTQANLVIFSCHWAQGLVGLEMLSFQYNFSSVLETALSVPLAADHTGRTGKAHELSRWQNIPGE